MSMFVKGVGYIRTDFDVRRQQMRDALRRCIDAQLQRGKTPENKGELHRIWSDGSVTWEGGIRRIDSWQPLLQHIEWVGSLRATPMEVGDSVEEKMLPLIGEGATSQYTYWEGDRKTCEAIRMYIAEYLIELRTIERDELLVAKQKRINNLQKRRT